MLKIQNNMPVRGFQIPMGKLAFVRVICQFWPAKLATAKLEANHLHSNSDGELVDETRRLPFPCHLTGSSFS
jgi:hypothetical protein